MKLSTVNSAADGVRCDARAARSWWVTSRSTSLVRLLIALLTTVTPVMPASWILRRSTDAPMADEPMPASQANTIERTGRPRAATPAAPAAAAPPARADEATDFLPFIDSIDAVAAARSPESSDLSMRRRKPPTRKVTAAERSTERMTPGKLPFGVCARTAMIEPGAAGARRPEPKRTLVKTPVIPPAMTARMRRGLAST